MFAPLIRILSQKLWPAAGDVDDCWVLASLMAVIAVSPWSWPVNVTQFRAAAGDPDKPGPTPGGVNDAYRAVRKLYPNLAVTLATGWTAAKILAAIKTNRPAYISVKAGALPSNCQFGFTGNHAVMLMWRAATGTAPATLYLYNPLAPAYAGPITISEAAITKAMNAHTGGPAALIMPSVEDAFKTHPLYQAPAAAPGGITQAQQDAAVLAGKRQQWDTDGGAVKLTSTRP
jgi:hypothetical protein